jgi:hypothetical protein
LLRSRLTRRGLALSTVFLTAALSESLAPAAVSATLLEDTYQTAILSASGQAAGTLSPAVATLAQAGLESVLWTRIRSGILWLAVLLTIGGAGWSAYRALIPGSAVDVADAQANRAIALPPGAQTPVLTWDRNREGLTRRTDEPQLLIRADGSLKVTDPYGPGQTLDGSLSAAELQELLCFAIDGQDFFRLEERGLRDERGPAPVTTSLHIRADGKDRALRRPSHVVATSDARKLQAIEQRLERLVAWVNAGQRPGVDAAVRLANEQLASQFPDAPLLTPSDLQSALRTDDDQSEVTLERRGVSKDRDPFSFVYARIERAGQGQPKVTAKANLEGQSGTARVTKKPNTEPINVEPPPIAKDPTVKYDYDIVYVRAPRYGDNKQIRWTEVFSPLRGEPGSDLMLLHPDGSEEVLVAAGDDAVTDPFVSFDGEWVYYARFHNAKQPGSENLTSQSADIFRIHVKTKKVVQLTQQVFTPNTGVAVKDQRAPGVYNLAPCPLPGGKVMFTSNRNGFAPTKGYTPTTLQLFVVDDDGANVEMIGHLNINSALHPTILKDGRVMFTSYESQGLRDLRLWALWSIHPDGTNWGPLFSAFGPSGDTAYHFMTQLSDEHIVVEEYYNLNNLGFGTYFKFAPRAPEGQPFFGPANTRDPRNLPYNGSAVSGIPFSPQGLEWLTTFCTAFDAPARLSDPKNESSPRVGKVTHPSGAPDNHLLTVWSPGPVNSNNGLKVPAIDGGIYLMKGGKAIDEPGQMLLIKNDPNYNEQWPRALVPYKRIYGVDEPARLTPLVNDGTQSPHLPEGTPYGLVGTSSLLKHESYPHGTVGANSVRGAYPGGNDPFQGLGTLAYTGISGNWFVQGADTARYGNQEIHAIRILITEPTTDGRYSGKRRWWNVANERLRILGEIPVRKFGRDAKASEQPFDPDGNPDTSFLAKIPADTPFTFQTLDKDSMVLNMAQTWHQLRPGEIRHDCGGCHSHSQKPTLFKDTAAAKADYPVFDLTKQTPLLTAKQNDQSGKKWDEQDKTGLRFEKAVKNVEFFRDIKPILDRSCVACHTQKADKPAGNLVLDDDQPTQAADGIGGLVAGPPGKVPGTYLRLAMDHAGKFGHPSPVGNWSHPQASRYVRMFQARRSLLVWKIFGKRVDGFSNDDFAIESVPGDPNSLVYKGKRFPNKPETRRLVNLAYSGSTMPPPQAVAGNYEGPDGKKIKVPPLSDEDRRTLVRWIDLGCPIDLDFDPLKPQERGNGWLQDDSRPTLTLTYPRAGANPKLTRILVGMHDYDSGLDADSFQVIADFPLESVPAGQNLAGKFTPKTPGVWELQLSPPLEDLAKGKLTVSVKDRQGNTSRIERTFCVGKTGE